MALPGSMDELLTRQKRQALNVKRSNVLVAQALPIGLGLSLASCLVRSDH